MRFTDEELNQIMEEIHEVRIDKLQGRARDLFYAIMQIADQRDEYCLALKKIKRYIHSEEFFMLMNSGSIISPPPDKPNGEDYFKAQGKLDKIIDESLGDDKNGE